MYFSYDGEDFNMHETEAEAKADAENAMDNWQEDAYDGWDDSSTQVCYGKITHDVRIETIPLTDENRHRVSSYCESLEEHFLERVEGS